VYFIAYGRYFLGLYQHSSFFERKKERKKERRKKERTFIFPSTAQLTLGQY